MPRVVSQTLEWLVVDKPAGWLTIPGSSGGTDRVLSSWAKKEFGEVWIVHRLDQETSGIVLFALTAARHRQANLWFQNHEVKKGYDCLARGVPSAPVFKVRQPVAGAPSVSQVEVKESYLEGFLARVNPVTGRRHQIRQHLAYAGHPIWGDIRYGGPAEVIIAGKGFAVERVALHAARLELPSGEVYEAPWPDDFRGWIERLRAEGHGV